MQVVIVDLRGKVQTRLAFPDGQCEALVFRSDDWRPCRSKATVCVGSWKFCQPHTRADEVEASAK